MSRSHLVDIADHLVNGLVLGLEAQGLHGRLELLGIDRARPVRVEQVERLPDLLDLLLRQPGPLVGLGRSLRGGSARLRRPRGKMSYIVRSVGYFCCTLRWMGLFEHLVGIGKRALGCYVHVWRPTKIHRRARPMHCDKYRAPA